LKIVEYLPLLGLSTAFTSVIVDGDFAQRVYSIANYAMLVTLVSNIAWPMPANCLSSKVGTWTIG
jgi:hypothetical protein